MEHVRVGEDDVAGRADGAACVGRGVAVVGESADVLAEVGDEIMEFVELVLGEGLRREEIERASRRVAEDSREDGRIEAERLTAGGGSHDRDIRPGESVGDGLCLVSVGAIDSAFGEDASEAFVDAFGPVCVAGRAGIDASDDDIGRFRLEFGDDALGDERCGDGPDSRDGRGRRRFCHSEVPVE